MNDLDLRTALHRDADLAGEPPADLLDQLVRRRSHQRRTRAAVLGAVAAVVVIAAGIPVGASLMTRSDGGPATQTVEPSPPSVSSSAPSTTPSVDPTPPETGAAVTTAASDTEAGTSTADASSAPLVTAWSRQTLYDLSFAVPVDPRVQGVAVPNPEAYSVYDWNESASTPVADPPVHLSVATSATDRLPSTDVPDPNREMLTLAGAARAWVTHEASPPGLFPGDYRDYFVNILTSGPRFYMVHIQVPATDEGAEVAQTFIDSLHMVNVGN